MKQKSFKNYTYIREKKVKLSATSISQSFHRNSRLHNSDEMITFPRFQIFLQTLQTLRTQKSQRIPSPARLHIRHSRQFAIRSRAQSGRSIYFSSIDGVNSLYIEHPRHRVSLRQA